ncbi:G-X-X-X-Q-X-W domain-containing protein [Pholiota conissans]|uniref:G-X-X-X-Q-X-W domain-containing protein n=1 Tax=Pholiota conissans TaxID=109636 RepID=A0A9P5Z9M8_9AGAR|nr:G-X-X-X-Q-X-W domain-containing protein [Pholiota conissans]
MRLIASIITALLPFLSFVNANRIFTIENHCPSTIKVFSGGQLRGSIAPRRSISKTFPDDWSGFIYTDANGGSAKGSKSTKAGFFGETDYYYIVKDRKGFNAGVSVVPKATPTGAFCGPAECNSSTCSGGFGSTPTRFPGPENTAPVAPLFACPGRRIGYTVTFCPSGTFPIPKNAVSLRPNGDDLKCVNVHGDNFTEGSSIEVADCKDTPSQKWILKRGQTTIQLGGTPFCLDAGSKPENPSGIRLSACTKGSSSQTWKYDEDDEISLDGTNLCLDLTNGSVDNGNQLQTNPCNYQNKNQLWKINLRRSP